MGGGWGAFGTREQDRTMAKQEHVKLLSPPGQVLEELNLTGFGSLFEVFTDLTREVDSFRQRASEMGNR